MHWFRFWFFFFTSQKNGKQTYFGFIILQQKQGHKSISLKELLCLGELLHMTYRGPDLVHGDAPGSDHQLMQPLVTKAAWTSPQVIRGTEAKEGDLTTQDLVGWQQWTWNLNPEGMGRETGLFWEIQGLACDTPSRSSHKA